MDCNLKTMKLLDCVHIGICAVIGSNMVIIICGAGANSEFGVLVLELQTFQPLVGFSCKEAGIHLKGK